MSAIPRRQRRLDRMMLGGTLLAVVAVPLLGYAGARALLDSTGGRDAREDNLPLRTFPATPAVAWFLTDDEGGLSSVAVLVLDPSRQGGSIVDLPVNADVGFDPERSTGLDEVFAEEGVDGALLAVESLTAVSLAFGFESGADEVEAVLAPLGQLRVDLVADVDVPGRSAPLAAGEAALDAGTAAAVLTEAAADSAEGFVGHRDNVVAVWAAVAEANGEGSRPAVADAPLPTEEQAFFDLLFAGRVGARPIAAVPFDETGEQVSGEETGLSSGTAPEPSDDSTDSTVADDSEDAAPARDDLVRLDRADAVFVFASIAPGSMSGPAPGMLFRLEAPPGYDAEVKRIVEVVLYFGGNVVSIDSTIAPRPDTVFIVPDEVNRDEAAAANVIFGEVAFADPEYRIEGVDITLVLGTDYLDSVEG